MRANNLAKITMAMALVLLFCAHPARAQTVTPFDLPAQPLARALKTLASQTKTNIIFDAKLVLGRRAPALRAQLTFNEALTRLLAGTGLKQTFINPTTVVLQVAGTPTGGDDASGRARSSADPPPAQTDSEQANAGASAGNMLDEVTVTATRQAEFAGKVPISLTAYTNATLDVRGFRDATDIFMMTPGVSYSSGGFLGSNSISIRGISSGSGASTVGIYIDDTPIQITSLGYDSTSAFPKLFDLQRVEILRGPQGTLFGASSEGGTIRFITPQPSLTQWSTFDRAEVAQIDGGGLSYEAGTAGGGPLIAGKLGFRASAYYRHDGGWIDRYNELSGQLLDANSNSSNAYVLQGALLWAVTDDFRVKPSIMYQKTMLNDSSAYWELISDPDRNIFRSMDPLPQPDPDFFVLPAIDLDYSADNFEVVSDTSYFRRFENPNADYSLLIPGIFTGESLLPQLPNYRAYAPYQGGFRTFVEDARIQSINPDARLKWTFGIYYNNSRESADEQIVDRDFASLIELLYGGTLQQVTGLPLIDDQYTALLYLREQNQEVASYGEVGYELLPGLRATVGLRVSRIRLSGSTYNSGPFAFGTFQGASSSTEHAVTPKYNLSWQINDASLVYATVDKGFRPGGGNTAIGAPPCLTELEQMGYSQAPLTYNEDSLWNYELGTKDRIFDGSAEITASLFRIDWTGIQQSVYLANCGQSFNDNLGRATSKGFDFSLNQHIGSLLYLVQVGYTDAHYSRDLVLTPGALPVVRAGDALQVNPWTISMGVQYDFSVLHHRSLVRLDWAGNSGHKLAAINDPTTSSYSPNSRIPESSSFFNLRVGTSFGDMRLFAFADNLFNAHPILSGSTNGGAQYFQDVTLAPRTIGVTVEYRH